jgi:hypothetical protein
MERKCYKCGVEIQECMGICLARDVLAILEGRQSRPYTVREMCGRCAVKLQFEKPNGSIGPGFD